MHIGHSLDTTYNLSDDAGNITTIEQIAEAKDLGDQLTADLKSSTHSAVS